MADASQSERATLLKSPTHAIGPAARGDPPSDAWSTVGQRLHRMRALRQQVDDRHGADRSHPLEHLVIEDPSRQHRVVARHDPGDVLDTSRGCRSRPPRPGCRSDARRAGRPPSPSTGGSGSTASRRSGRLRDRRAGTEPERSAVRPARAPCAARPAEIGDVEEVPERRSRQHLGDERHGLVDLGIGHRDRRSQPQRSAASPRW